MKPIETVYCGYRFRSRLEARWAVFFDALGVKWEYEPEGYDLGDAGWYLPDFWLPDYSAFIEVKPVNPNPDELLKMRRLAQGFAVDRNTTVYGLFAIGIPGQESTRFQTGFEMWPTGEAPYCDGVDLVLCQYAIDKWGKGSFYNVNLAGGDDMAPREARDNGAYVAAKSARFGQGGRG